MNFFTTYPLISLAAGSGLAVILLGWFVFDLHRKWNRMFGKPKKGAPSDALGEIMERLLKAEKEIRAIGPRVNVLEEISRIAVQKVGFMRFNPFENTGSDQSFAAALLDRENNGLVLSSLYTREGVRVYAKEIKAGESKHQLSDEEKKVLEQAIRGTKFQITNHKFQTNHKL